MNADPHSLLHFPACTPSDPPETLPRAAASLDGARTTGEPASQEGRQAYRRSPTSRPRRHFFYICTSRMLIYVFTLTVITEQEIILNRSIWDFKKVLKFFVSRKSQNV